MLENKIYKSAKKLSSGKKLRSYLRDPNMRSRKSFRSQHVGMKL